MKEYPVPQWLRDYVDLWADRLGLYPEWRKIGIEICRVISDDAGTLAHADRDVKLNEAVLRFNCDVEDTHEWRQTVVHELLHVKHTRIDAFYRGVVVPQLSSSAGEMASEGYNQHMESYIESMAQILYAMWATKEKTPRRKAKIPA